MRRRYLYIDPRGADIYYSAKDIIDFTGKGTIVLWAWVASVNPGARTTQLLRIVSSDTETKSSLCNSHFYGWNTYDDSGKTTFTAPTDYYSYLIPEGPAGWQMLVCEWDFPTKQIRGFIGRNYVGDWKPCVVPSLPATKIYLGPKVGTAVGDPTYLQYLAIWKDSLTQDQINTLYDEGPRYIPKASDGTGELALLSTFNESVNSSVSLGDNILHVDASASDRYALVDDGQREYCRQTYFLGQPHHDNREFDRNPLWAILHPGFSASSYLVDNLDTESQIVIPQDATQADIDRGPMIPGARVVTSTGMLCLTPIRPFDTPTTYRVRMRLDSAAAPAGEKIRLGVIDYIHYPLASTNVFDVNGYGSYQSLTVVADVNNSPTQFKTDLAQVAVDYWKDAYCLFTWGANQGRSLKVSSFDPVNKILTLESPLPQAPLAGDVAILGFWARLQGVDTQGQLLPWQNLEVIMDESYSNAYMPEIDFVYVYHNVADQGYPARYRPNYARFDRGRTVVMEGMVPTSWTSSSTSPVYGRPKGSDDPKAFYATLRMAKIEMSGPGKYQLLRKTGGEGPSLADNFLIQCQDNNQLTFHPIKTSVKAWRQKNVSLKTQVPTKISDYQSIQTMLKSAPWRAKSASAPYFVVEDGKNRAICTINGTDASGFHSIGYVVCEPDGDSIKITDETPPEGKNNPFMSGNGMGLDIAEDSPTIYSLAGGVLPLDKGQWMLSFPAKIGNPDHTQGGLLVGAPDRWSFDREKHWLRDNPLMGIRGAVDRPNIFGGGSGTWSNRDGGFGIFYDKFTENTSRRYLAYARGKSLIFGYTKTPHDIRPMVGMRSPDGRVWSPLPEGRELTPLCSPEHSVGGMFIYDDGTVALSPQGGGLRVSEDGVHWNDVMGREWFYNDDPSDDLPGEGGSQYVVSSFRLGDKRIYFYTGSLGINIATIRYNGEADYELDAGSLDGFLETPAIELCESRELVINADPGGGSVSVEVLNAEDDSVIPGFERENCIFIQDSIEKDITWGEKGISSINVPYIRLKFYFHRDDASQNTPKLYSWRLNLKEASEPTTPSEPAPTNFPRPGRVFFSTESVNYSLRVK
jgi:hypothetical protein